MDKTFPSEEASPTEPSRAVIKRIKYAINLLSNYYKGLGKLSIQRHFDQRVLDGERIVDLKTLEAIMDKPRKELPAMLTSLEATFREVIKKTNMAPKLTDKKVSFNILLNSEHNV
ncbi:MAG: hypothetical protein ACRYE7_00280 [Janthinobacterium lividum]